jgi:hypothetical protein
MFDFLKRLLSPAAKPAAQPAMRRRKSRSATVTAEPIPVPEVVEGNDHTDWDLWEDSVNTLDSRMQSITPSSRIYDYSSTQPSELGEVDVFSRVSKNRDL